MLAPLLLVQHIYPRKEFYLKQEQVTVSLLAACSLWCYRRVSCAQNREVLFIEQKLRELISVMSSHAAVGCCIVFIPCNYSNRCNISVVRVGFHTLEKGAKGEADALGFVCVVITLMSPLNILKCKSQECPYS